MKPIYAVDAWFTKMMDEISFWFQVRVGIPRFYLVPLLNLGALIAIYLKDSRGDSAILGAAFTLITFSGLLTMHFFHIHKRGAETPDMQVNIAVEGMRSNPLYLTARVFAFVMLAGIVVACLITEPSQVPLEIMAFLFLWYPSMIYQHEVPPRRSFAKIFSKKGGLGPSRAVTSNRDAPSEIANLNEEQAHVETKRHVG